MSEINLEKVARDCRTLFETEGDHQHRLAAEALESAMKTITDLEAAPVVSEDEHLKALDRIAELEANENQGETPVGSTRWR